MTNYAWPFLSHIFKCIILLKKMVSKNIFYWFCKHRMMFTKAAFIWFRNTIKQLYCEMLLQFKITVSIYFKMSFISVTQSCIFSIITPVFSVTWSVRNHSNMTICCSRNISYYQCWKHVCCLICLVENVIFFPLMHWKFKSAFILNRFFLTLWKSILSLLTI